jgi:hypothetical protein
MKTLKDMLKKPIVALGMIGALGLGVGTLTLKNIGLKNQNDYLFNQYTDVGKRYSNSVIKYNQLIKDSMEISTQHSLESISLKWDNLKLASKIDSLQKDYTNFAENLKESYLQLAHDIDSLQSNYTDFANFAEKALETSKERRDLFEQIITIAEEKEFYKKYAAHLDSLLLRCESSNMLPDKK